MPVATGVFMGAVRYGNFQDRDVYWEGQVRWLHLPAVYRSKRRWCRSMDYGEFVAEVMTIVAFSQGRLQTMTDQSGAWIKA